jgi:CDP-6-deoxy-D-xylo-4-hexulose-3-dehydrase
VLQAGAIPVFVDCDPQTLQMTPQAVEAAITPKTAAIVVVHVLGGAVDMSAVRAIAERKRLWLIEDTCESLGVEWDGNKVGSFGQLGTFSFFFSHHITTVEGGMVVTNDARLADLLRAMRAHGWVRHMQGRKQIEARYPDIDPRFLFLTTGFNVRPTEINGAIGLEQLKRLAGFNETRRSIAGKLDQGLAPLAQKGLLSLIGYDKRSKPAPFGYTVLCRSHDERQQLVKHLEQSGIETRPVICGNLVRQPALEHFGHRVSGTLKGADRVMDCGLYWGTHPFMGDDDVRYIIETVTRFFK